MRNLIFIIGVCFVYGSCEQKVPYPQVVHPKDNASNAYKVELGKKLFFDTRLSKDNTISCATCHQPNMAFSDNLLVSFGIEGKMVHRNVPSIINAAYLTSVMFDGELKTLELQTVVPLQEPTEMDMDLKVLMKRLKAIPAYEKLSKLAFGHSFDAWSLTRSLACYVRSLVSWKSRFDDYYFQHKNTLSKDELAGYKLFSEKLYCAKCHVPPHFTNFETASNGIRDTNDGGRFEITGDCYDFGKFKIPSLKNIAITFPYMHNGSMKSLDDVINYYEKGGDHGPNQSEMIQKFSLSKQEKAQLKAFFFSLTDTSLNSKN